MRWNNHTQNTRQWKHEYISYTIFPDCSAFSLSLGGLSIFRAICRVALVQIKRRSLSYKAIGLFEFPFAARIITAVQIFPINS